MPEPPRFGQIRGDLTAGNLHFALVVSRFNSFITERLLAGALDVLERAGATAGQIDVARVPGSFEVPITAKKMAASGRYEVVICIGCICRAKRSISNTSPRKCARRSARAARYRRADDFLRAHLRNT